MTQHPVDRIGAYADGELPGDEARALEAHLEACTECAREVALIRALGGGMRAMETEPVNHSVWGGVRRRITRPVGWVLVLAGVAVWAVLAFLEWFRTRALTPEWLGWTAFGIGIALLAVSVAYEQYRDWKDSPYKDVER